MSLQDLKDLLKENGISSVPSGKIESHKLYTTYAAVLPRLQDGDIIHVRSYEGDTLWEITCCNTGKLHTFLFLGDDSCPS